MVQQGKRFFAHKVDVRGLSRKQTKAKRKYEYRMWKLYYSCCMVSGVLLTSIA